MRIGNRQDEHPITGIVFTQLPITHAAMLLLSGFLMSASKQAILA
jgi:hypothetical protein